MVGIFDGEHWQHTFVGRETDLNCMRHAWDDGKQLFCIYGLRCIGKTRFAQELVRRCNHECDFKIELNGVESENDFNIIVTSSFEITQKYSDLSMIAAVRSKVITMLDDKEKNVIILIENAEVVEENNAVKLAFINLCRELVKLSPRVRVLITSVLKFGFPGLSKPLKEISLQPLSLEDSRELLHQLAPTIDCDGSEDDIVNLCGRLPYAIDLAAAQLNGNDGASLTPGELLNLLLKSQLYTLSGEEYAQEEQMNFIVTGVIGRLKEVFQQYYASLDFIPGSFNKKAVTAVTGFDDTADAMAQVIRPLIRRSLLSYNPDTQRYDINSLYREAIRDNIQVRDILGVRARFSKFYSDCLVQLQKLVDSKDTDKAVCPLKMDLQNFKKLLQVAAFSPSDGTFDVFIKAATEANFLIMYYMPDQSISFYEVMLDACQDHGTSYEMGFLMSIFGEMLSDQRGDYQKSLELYFQSEEKLKPSGDSRPLAEVYQHIGWYHYVHQNCEESIKFLLKSYEMLKNLGFIEDLQTARVLNCLGITHCLMGNANESEKYHMESLGIRLRLLGERHLSIAAHYNNIGLMYELKGDDRKALEFFKKSLELKKEVIGPSKTVLISIRNVGLQYCKVGKFQEALDLAKEGDDILDKLKEKEIFLKANVLEVYGMAYLGLEQYEKAEKFLKELVQISEERIPGKPTLVKSMNRLGQVMRMQGKNDEAETILLNANKMKEVAKKDRPKKRMVFENLHELAKLYEDVGDLNRAASFYFEALDELHRIGDCHIRDNEQDLSKTIHAEITSLLQTLSRGNLRMRLNVPVPCSDEHSLCCLRYFGDIVYEDGPILSENDKEEYRLGNNLDSWRESDHNQNNMPRRSADLKLGSGMLYSDVNSVASWVTKNQFPLYAPELRPPVPSSEQISFETKVKKVRCDSDVGLQATSDLNRSFSSSQFFADVSDSGNDHCLPFRLDSYLAGQNSDSSTNSRGQCTHLGTQDDLPKVNVAPLSQPLHFTQQSNQSAPTVSYLGVSVTPKLDENNEADCHHRDYKHQITPGVASIDHSGTSKKWNITKIGMDQNHSQLRNYLSSDASNASVTLYKPRADSLSTDPSSEELYLGASDLEEKQNNPSISSNPSLNIEFQETTSHRMYVHNHQSTQQSHDITGKNSVHPLDSRLGLSPGTGYQLTHDRHSPGKVYDQAVNGFMAGQSALPTPTTHSVLCAPNQASLSQTLYGSQSSASNYQNSYAPALGGQSSIPSYRSLHLCYPPNSSWHAPSEGPQTKDCASSERGHGYTQSLDCIIDIEQTQEASCGYGSPANLFMSPAISDKFSAPTSEASTKSGLDSVTGPMEMLLPQSGNNQGMVHGTYQGEASGNPQGIAAGNYQGVASGNPQVPTSGNPQVVTSGTPQEATSGTPQEATSGLFHSFQSFQNFFTGGSTKVPRVKHV